MLAGLAHRLKPSTFTGRLIRFPLKFVPRGQGDLDPFRDQQGYALDYRNRAE